MLNFPLSVPPTEDDLDPAGRILAFVADAGIWQVVRPDELSEGLHRAWRRCPAAPLGPATHPEPQFVVEPAPGPGGGMSAARVSDPGTGLALVAREARTFRENERRGKAALGWALDVLSGYSGEITLLEESLQQALALALILVDAQKSPLGELVSAQTRDALAPSMRELSRTLPYFAGQGIWEHMASLFGQLVEVAVAGSESPLQRSLVDRLDDGTADAGAAEIPAGERARLALSSSASVLSALFGAAQDAQALEEEDLPSFDEPLEIQDLAYEQLVLDEELGHSSVGHKASSEVAAEEGDEGAETAEGATEAESSYAPVPGFGF